MNRGEGAAAFAVMAGAMFLVTVMGCVFGYAFRPGAVEPFILCGFLGLGLGMSATLYGLSTVLRLMGSAPPPPAEAPAAPRVDTARAELMGGEAKKFASPAEMMSSVRTLIELENWKLAHQRAFELVEAYPDSEEAAKVKKNLDYLQQKAG